MHVEWVERYLNWESSIRREVEEVLPSVHPQFAEASDQVLADMVSLILEGVHVLGRYKHQVQENPYGGALISAAIAYQLGAIRKEVELHKLCLVAFTGPIYQA